MKDAAHKSWNPRHFDVRAFSEAAASLEGDTELAHMARLSAECHPEGGPVAPVRWHVRGELRPGGDGQPAVWLHVRAGLMLPLACQRCLGPVATPLSVDRWFRFVADEATAESQDDQSEEDVLALEPRPDLLSLIEDELLMAMPLVPMHEACPEPLAGSASTNPGSADSVAEARPNPFASLANLRRPSRP
jgi:uncharacterized protein